MSKTGKISQTVATKLIRSKIIRLEVHSARRITLPPIHSSKRILLIFIIKLLHYLIDLIKHYRPLDGITMVPIIVNSITNSFNPSIFNNLLMTANQIKSSYSLTLKLILLVIRCLISNHHIIISNIKGKTAVKIRTISKFHLQRDPLVYSNNSNITVHTLDYNPVQFYSHVWSTRS
jgi:hypothetical protein